MRKRVTGSRKFSGPSHPKGTFTVILNLECGHGLRRRGSQSIPKHAWCNTCADNAEEARRNSGK